MVIDLDKFAETVIRAVKQNEVFSSSLHQHKDYIIKKDFVRQVIYEDGATFEIKNQSILFFRNSDDDKRKCKACLVSWDFDNEYLWKFSVSIHSGSVEKSQTEFSVSIHSGFIEKSQPENFHTNDFAESIYVTWFQEIIRKIIDGVL